MIYSNLAVLLAERDLSITKVSKDTGISRTTLTALCTNHGQGIQFDTLNTLCIYLGITPDKLIAFVPVNIEVSHIEIHDNDKSCIISLNIIEKGRHRVYSLIGFLFLDYEEDKLREIGIVLNFKKDTENPDNASQNVALLQVLKKLPVVMLYELQKTITNDILVECESNLGIRMDGFEEGYRINFYWPDELTEN